MTAPDVRAMLTGFPRIGQGRELKWLLERAWRGEIEPVELDRQLAERKRAHLAEQVDLVGVALDDFWIYDQVLETALLFGLVPAREATILRDDPFACLTALARGSTRAPAWEMTKWFDTNYHYVVPEGDVAGIDVSVPPWRVPAGDAWNVLGPFSFARLSRLTDLQPEALLPEYQRLAAAAGLPLVIDEPSLGLEPGADDLELLARAYSNLDPDPTIVITCAVGTPDDAILDLLASRGLSVQVAARDVPRVASLPAWNAMPRHVVSVVDGRSPWPDDWSHLADASRHFDGRPVLLTPTTSLMFLPYTVADEPSVAAAGFQFAREKATTLAAWAAALREGRPAPDATRPMAAVDWPAPPNAVPPRGERPQRRAQQPSHGELPTTTIGSYPQTSVVRQLRRQLRDGVLGAEEYQRNIDEAIVDCVRWQEAAGLDLLVHGEFERTDMVEYFAERLDGFLTTSHGWVVSYGARCTRPPILVAPPRPAQPITVREWQVAQAATDRPVKGMLTGPVTIVNWSFRPPQVGDDRLFWAVARAVRDEVEFLIAAGARAIQVDEPAVRERWPLKAPGWQERRDVYRDGARRALQHVFHQPDEVQMHTHMCYGDFGEIVDLWRGVDVDVASIEFARSGDESYLAGFAELGWEIGPGLFDVHSPHRPGREAVVARLRRALEIIPRDRLWVNPDCGLKTRSWSEVEQQLDDMLAGSAEVRRS